MQRKNPVLFDSYKATSAPRIIGFSKPLSVQWYAKYVSRAFCRSDVAIELGPVLVKQVGSATKIIFGGIRLNVTETLMRSASQTVSYSAWIFNRAHCSRGQDWPAVAGARASEAHDQVVSCQLCFDAKSMSRLEPQVNIVPEYSCIASDLGK
jgi:hypothetical protein